MGRKTKYIGVRAVSESSIEITFKYQGTRQRERINEKPTDANLLIVYNFLCQIKEAINKGTFDYSQTFPKSKRARKYINKGILGTYMTAWLAQQTHLKAETRRNYQGVVNCLARSDIQYMLLAELTWGHIRDWALAMDVIPGTRTKRIGVLRTALDDAVDDALIDHNPTFGKKLKQQTVTIKRSATDIDPFSWDEREAIEKACCPQFGLMVRFMFFTGIRPEEARALTWDRVNLIERNIYIDRVITDASKGRFENPKTTHSVRYVELIKPAYDALIALKAHTFMKGDHVFVNPFDQLPFYRTDNIRNRWITALKKAGVRYRVPYQMRHTYASTALMEGEDLGYVRDQMGHKDISITLKHYARYIPENRKGRGSLVEQAWQEHKRG